MQDRPQEPKLGRGGQGGFPDIENETQALDEDQSPTDVLHHQGWGIDNNEPNVKIIKDPGPLLAKNHDHRPNNQGEKPREMFGDQRKTTVRKGAPSNNLRNPIEFFPKGIWRQTSSRSMLVAQTKASI